MGCLGHEQVWYGSRTAWELQASCHTALRQLPPLAPSPSLRAQSLQSTALVPWEPASLWGKPPSSVCNERP